MKASLTFAALALSIATAVSAQAQTATAPDAPPAHGDFASHKTAILAHLDKRIAAMTTARACVANAATQADLKACRQQSRGAMHSSTKRAPA